MLVDVSHSRHGLRHSATRRRLWNGFLPIGKPYLLLVEKGSQMIVVVHVHRMEMLPAKPRRDGLA